MIKFPCDVKRGIIKNKYGYRLNSENPSSNLPLEKGRWPKAGGIETEAAQGPVYALHSWADPSVTASWEIGCDSSLSHRELRSGVRPIRKNNNFQLGQTPITETKKVRKWVLRKILQL